MPAAARLWSLAKRLPDLSAWRMLGRVADRRLAAGGGKGWQATKRVAGVMDGPVGIGLGAYGMAGTMVPGGLPGDQLLGFAGMPGWTPAAAAPGAIRSARMTRQSNQDALRSDVEEGARRAGDDFLSVTQTSPDVFQRQGAYADLLRQHGLWGGDRPKPRTPGIKDFLFDNEAAMENAVRQRVAAFTKGASIFGTATKYGGGVLRALTIPAMLGSAYSIGDAALADKPYDPEMATREGYAGAQTAISRNVDAMSPWKRLALRLDPTLAASAMEQRSPGAIKRWEGINGKPYQPGWLADIANNWRQGGKQSFFTYDAKGNRHYI